MDNFLVKYKPSAAELSQDTGSSKGTAINRNADGSINIPSDGSRYIPQAGDVIRCDDGTNYLILDADRWDNNLFASGPAGSLPEATCDWSQFPEQELPAVRQGRQGIRCVHTKASCPAAEADPAAGACSVRRRSVIIICGVAVPL